MKAKFKQQSRPKVPRGFFMVNLAKWEQDRLRALCREFGMELRTFLRYAIKSHELDLKEKLKIARELRIDPRETFTLLQGSEKN